MEPSNVFKIFSFSVFGPFEKVSYAFFLLNFLSKFIDMYPMANVLSLILLRSEILKIPRAKVGDQLVKKLAFLTNKCDTYINAKRLTLHLTNLLVNVALKFYIVNLASCNFDF